MEWNKLLSAERLGVGSATSAHRSVFNQDYGRVLYSSAFRRLQDKTQVFPLGRNDYVRTRLTHSLEVSNVGRGLAIELQDIVERKEGAGIPLLSGMGDIVSTACLAHDIGNPPFGHSGETAIESAVRELTGQTGYTFEGNAQGFRLLTRICDPIKDCGLNLTCATLGAFTKYPCTLATVDKAIYKKFGINDSELDAFEVVADKCGLPLLKPDVWARHPLAYLMESADDISYLIADLEDAFLSKIITFEEAVEQLFKLAHFSADAQNKVMEEKNRMGAEAAVRYARAMAVGSCIRAVAGTLEEHYDDIMSGSFRKSLMKHSPYAKEYEEVSDFSVQQIYSHESVIRVEVTGFNVIKKLMELYLQWVDNPASPLSKKIACILHADKARLDDPGYRFAHVIDYVSGMTDSYALKTYTDLFGHAPGM